MWFFEQSNKTSKLNFSCTALVDLFVFVLVSQIDVYVAGTNNLCYWMVRLGSKHDFDRDRPHFAHWGSEGAFSSEAISFPACYDEHGTKERVVVRCLCATHFPASVSDLISHFMADNVTVVFKGHTSKKYCPSIVCDLRWRSVRHLWRLFDEHDGRDYCNTCGARNPVMLPSKHNGRTSVTPFVGDKVDRATMKTYLQAKRNKWMAENT